MRSNKRIALAAAAMMAMESEVAQGPSASSAHPLHLLSLAPIKIPFLAPHSPGKSLFPSSPPLSSPVLLAVHPDLIGEIAETIISMGSFFFSFPRHKKGCDILIGRLYLQMLSVMQMMH